MHAIEVSIIAGILFIIIEFVMSGIMSYTLGYTYCDLTPAGQYFNTFTVVFLFTMMIEYTDLNYLICSGGH